MSGLGDGPISPGDTVDIQVFDMPELAVHAQVSPAGDIPMPLLTTVRVVGLTSTVVGDNIAAALKERRLVRDPHVTVSVQQLTSTFTVLGEVRSPGIYPSFGARRLIDVLSMAGGMTERAGHLIQIKAAGPATLVRNVLWDPTLLQNQQSDLPIVSGSTITVSRCGVVYVGGNVTRPGAYPICDSIQTTLSQAIALAQGTRPSSSFKNTVLIRGGAGVRDVRQVPLDRILKGKQEDIVMQADDIVYVAPSALKATMKRSIDVAIAFASTASIYGLR